MERIVAIGDAADVLGVSIATLRRWEAAGKLAAEHTAGGHRRYGRRFFRVPAAA
jgi:putative resolvase